MKRTIKFNLFPKKVGGVLVECRPIRMRVCYAGYRVDFRVGYSIEPEKWNEEEGRVISNTKNRFRQTAGEINKAITACEEQIEAIFTRFELLEKRVPTPGELKTTYTKFNSLRKHLEAFNKNLTFDEINEVTLQKFITSLHKADLRNTTISKNMSFLRWFLRWAHHKGYNPSNVHETFKPKFKGADGNAKEIIYLEWEELFNLYLLLYRPSLFRRGKIAPKRRKEGLYKRGYSKDRRRPYYRTE